MWHKQQNYCEKLQKVGVSFKDPDLWEILTWKERIIIDSWFTEVAYSEDVSALKIFMRPTLQFEHSAIRHLLNNLLKFIQLF